MAEIRTQRQDTCPACGSADAVPWRTDARDWEQPDSPTRYEYARCRDCEARFAAIRPIDADMPKAYFEGYAPYEAEPVERRAPAARAWTKAAGVPLAGAAWALERLRPDPLPARLERFYAPGGLLLDYGCGSSAFLDRARTQGWDTVGIDFVPGVVEGVRAAGHRAGLIDELADTLAGDRATAVRLNHVVEHLFAPRDTLAEIHAHLSTGGRIHIATPNPASLGSRLYKNAWYPLEAPRHAVIYPPQTLARLLEELGFRAVEVVHEVVGKDLVRSSAIRHGQRDFHAFTHDLHRARAVAPVAKAAALARRADRYHLFARA